MYIQVKYKAWVQDIDKLFLVFLFTTQLKMQLSWLSILIFFKSHFHLGFLMVIFTFILFFNGEF